MSFNLNKGDEPSGSARKSNFDLSKGGSEGNSGASKRSNYWPFALIAVLLIGGAVWYFTQQGITGKAPAGDTTASAAMAQAEPKGIRSDSGSVAGQPAVSREGAPENTSRIRAADARAGAPGPEGAHTAAAMSPDAGVPVIAASFKAGSAEPQVLAKSILEIRRKMKNGINHKINVWGYASSEGSLTVNQAISQARADAYKKLLVKKGIADTLITALGRGIENSIASNDTEEGRKKNRRVEVHFNYGH